MTRGVCVVGAGRWGKNHIRTLAELDCLAGIVETNPEIRSRLADVYPGAKLFSSVSQTFQESFDGYTVATPADTHYSIAKMILENRRHVLVEKPLAFKARQAVELRDLARNRGVNLMVGHVLLFHPAVRKIKQLIDDGKIGKLQYLYSNRLNLGTVRTEENILWSFAPHDISIFDFFVGNLPEKVVSRGGAFIQPHLHDTTMTILRYPGNTVGHIFVSWLHPFKEHRLVLIGSKGMLSFEDSSDQKHILFYEKGIDWIRGEPVRREGPTEEIPYDRHMPLSEELRYFVEHLDGRPVEVATAENAVRVLDILEKATESLLSGNEVSLTRPFEDKTRYFLHPSSYLDENVEVGEGTKIWHFCHVQSGARIGRNCTLGQNVNIGNNVRIGNFVKIQNNVSVYEGVELEDYVFCGPSMVFTNIRDPRCKYPQRGSEHYVKTLVKEGASIGANATVICGNTIGRHAFIAAGAVVTRDVPDYALMVGVPAVQKGWVCECGQVLPKFEQSVVCPRCGLHYKREENRLVMIGACP